MIGKKDETKIKRIRMVKNKLASGQALHKGKAYDVPGDVSKEDAELLVIARSAVDITDEDKKDTAKADAAVAAKDAAAAAVEARAAATDAKATGDKKAADAAAKDAATAAADAAKAAKASGGDKEAEKAAKAAAEAATAAKALADETKDAG